MAKYLVEASVQRLAAYRCYREQIGTYWTVRRLERLQWEYLYGLVSITSKFAAKTRQIGPTRQRVLLTARTMLCASMSMAEELIPLKVLDQFFAKHEEYARLVHKYPQARILKDTLPLELIDAYRSTFATDEVLPDSGFKLLQPKEYRCSWWACQVAEAARYIAVPRAQVSRAVSAPVHAWLSTFINAARVSQYMSEGGFQILGDVWQLVLLPALPVNVLQRRVLQRICVSPADYGI